MERLAFTIRPSVETGETIEELAKLLGVTKNKLLSAILEESRPDMEEMIEHLKSLDTPLSAPYSNLHSQLMNVIIQAAKSEHSKIEEYNSDIDCESDKKQLPTYFSKFLEK